MEPHPSDFVGVVHPAQLKGELKRELLMFDRIAVCDDPWKVAPQSRDLDWLRNEGVLFDAGSISDEFLDANDGLMDLIVPSIATANSLRDLHEEHQVPTQALLTAKRALQQRYYHLQTRISAIKLRRADGLDAVPLFQMTEMINESVDITNEGVLRIIIHELPVPDEKTGLQDIMNFRNDLDAKMASMRLRIWIKDVAMGEIDTPDIYLKLTSALREYEHYLHLHKIKFGLETTATIAEAGLNIGDLLTFNYGGAARSAFAFRKEASDIKIAELSAPGREVAYISMARSEFR